MQLEKINAEYAAYLVPDEVGTLIDCAPTRQIAVEIMFLYLTLARTIEGQRAKAGDLMIHRGCPSILVRPKTTDLEETGYDLRLIPQRLWDELQQWKKEDNRTGDIPLFGVRAKTMQKHVKRAVENVAEQEDDPRWHKVSSHDLRRSAANWLYHNGMSKYDIAQHGGWKNVESLEPYLTHKPISQLNAELERVGWFSEGAVTSQDRIKATAETAEANREMLLQLCARFGIEPNIPSAPAEEIGPARENEQIDSFGDEHSR